MNSRQDIAVLFLARGIGGGLSAAEDFFATYRAHDSGVPHELIVLVKGWEGVEGLDRMRKSAAALGAGFLELPDDGFDLTAYFRAAMQVGHRYVCLLNTHSRIRADHWLFKLLNGIRQPGVGAAGATGLWQSGFSDVVAMPLVRDVPWQWWLLYPLRVIMNAYRFRTFPNPYLRTNALLLERERYLQFMRARGAPTTKMKAQVLESGRKGLSCFIRESGHDIVVVGADGRVFKIGYWPESGTFFVPGHPNLLVSDNQTRAFDTSDEVHRQILAYRAWGQRTPNVRGKASWSGL